MTAQQRERLRQLEQRAAERPSAPSESPELEAWLLAVREYLSESLIERGPVPVEGAAERQRDLRRQIEEIIAQKQQEG